MPLNIVCLKKLWKTVILKINIKISINLKTIFGCIIFKGRSRVLFFNKFFESKRENLREHVILTHQLNFIIHNIFFKVVNELFIIRKENYYQPIPCSAFLPTTIMVRWTEQKPGSLLGVLSYLAFYINNMYIDTFTTFPNKSKMVQILKDNTQIEMLILWEDPKRKTN